MNPFTVIIPARYASTRLPAKPLADIHGKPMVVRVAERALASGAQAVWIAADDERILSAANTHNISCLMTSVHHASGTDRIAEASRLLHLPDEHIIVNVQGDEPLIEPALIRQVAQELSSHPDAPMATLCHPIHDEAAFRNPNIVKVVINQQGNALYFSRAAIPWPRAGWQTDTTTALRHMGLYAYRVSFLHQFSQLPPTSIEETEALEQLRVLWHGFPIHVGISPQAAAPGVDTVADLDYARANFQPPSPYHES